ncbi:benzoate 4-monooxygenase cytochrome P450 [Corynespora cassiicola Philippines]|uniref:Benzoate 4-monooxygenase cytochrome P450 n=1 Tax=Corynespora cassiicola Philippines TaxID=1448308 RepID=A0A2T2PAZ4_CORCC|nr:benzoate 4-monooxygenase cytochrome P450 [Corynespora cassiicola Philippines]
MGIETIDTQPRLNVEKSYFAEKPGTLIAGVLALSVLTLVTQTIYSLYFHPLSKYPGPFLSRATELAYWHAWLTGDLVYYIQKIHDQYGETVRISPSRISTLQPQAWKDIHGHKTGGKKAFAMKDPSFYVPNIRGNNSLLSTFDDSAHGKLRKIFTHGFSDRALKLQEDLIRAHVDKLIENIRRETEKDTEAKIDAVKMYNCTTFDIIGELAFGEHLGLLDNSELNDWVKHITGSLESSAFRALFLEYSLLGRIATWITPKSVIEEEEAMYRYTSDLVEKRMAKGKVTEKNDFWTLVLAQHDSGSLDVEDVKANADLFMVAGSETTATMLSGLTYILLMNPDKMEKLVKEIRGSFQSESELTIENIARLKYLSACFDESLRLYPATPLGPPRVVVNGGGVLNGEFIPEGTRVSVAQYAAYRSPLNFKDPLLFVPERWITDDPQSEKYASDRRDVFQPFSYGPRNCIGKNLALHEMRLIAVKMLWHFDLELCEESRGTFFNQKTFWALWEKPPLWVRAKAVRR